jgi:DNA modification methylase
VTPFNLLPVGADGKDGRHKHPGKTPLALARWWARYICPPGGLVLDPFGGSGTTGVAALAEARRCLLVERMPEYVAIARRRTARPVAWKYMFILILLQKIKELAL